MTGPAVPQRFFPGRMIAQIPGMFAYFPRDALVLVGLDWLDDALQPVELAYVGLEQVLSQNWQHAMFRDLRRLPHVFAVIVTPHRETQQVDDITEHAYVAQVLGTNLIEACWHVADIAHGEPFSLVFATPGLLGYDVRKPPVMFGSVADPEDNDHMRLLHSCGVRPAARFATFAGYWAYSEDLAALTGVHSKAATQEFATTNAVVDVATSALRRAHRALMDLNDGNADRAVDLVYAARDVLRSAVASELIEPTHSCPQIVLVDDPHELEVLIAALSVSKISDCLITEALDHPQQTAGLLMHVAKTTHGEARAHALGMWALIALQEGITPWTLQALRQASAEMPSYTPARVIGELLRQGRSHEVISRAHSGSQRAWAELLLPPDAMHWRRT